MRHSEIMQQIGELFLLRININLVGSVLDYPVRRIYSYYRISTNAPFIGSVLGKALLVTFTYFYQ